MTPHNFIDLTGQVFFRLTVIRRNPQNSSSDKVRWDCLCTCGGTAIVITSELKSGHTGSCGCWHREYLSRRKTTHGYRANGKFPVEYSRWTSMITRCGNPKAKDFPYYGGRGIQVCDAWRHDFPAYLDHVRSIGFTGANGQTLDRIDNDGNYEPGNLRVTNHKTNCRNRSSNRIISAFGENLCLTEWSERTGLTRSTIFRRIFERHWSPERALSTPITPTLP